ncbi:MAG: CinA family protein [Bacteroidota bacterium]
MDAHIIPPHILENAEELVKACKAQKLKVSLAESCTGGMLSMLLTAVPGSSAVLDRSLVTYSNEAKQELLGVKKETMIQHGAVSEPTVREMMEGLFLHTTSDLGAAISGIAGPGGGSPDKPVGLVYIGWGRREAERQVKAYRFSGDRREVRVAACEQAMSNLLALI